jgi:ATP-dependent helicase/nuclease subunit A
VLDETAWRDVQQELAKTYPYLSATRNPAKTSVTGMRRGLAEDELALVRRPRRVPVNVRAANAVKLSATEIGNAHHAFLRAVSLDAVGSAAELRREAERLRQAAVLNETEVSVLDIDGLWRFWNSELGQRVKAQRQYVRRELAFTVRIRSDELARLSGAGAPAESMPDDEWVIVQGVADLALLAPEGLTVVDFKTDDVDATGVAALAQFYAPQVRLYADALSRIYRRPPTSCWLYFIRPGEAVEVG